MEPTDKAPEIDRLLSALTGRDRKESVRQGDCVTCGGEAKTFRDDLSRREFAISGMCQKCQDDVFGK